MAERIKIAELDLDIQKLIKAATDSKEALLKLRAEQAALKKAGQEASPQFVRNEAEIRRLTYSYRAQSEAIRVHVSEGGRLQDQQLAISEAVGKLNLTERDMRENNKQLLALRRDLNRDGVNYQKNLDEINKKLNENNDFIKENASNYEQTKINAGNYTESIIQAYRAIEAEKQSLKDLNDELIISRNNVDENSEEWKILNQQINNNITQINIYNNQMSEARGEQEGFNKVLELTSGGLGGFVTKAKEAGGAGPLLSQMFAALRTGILGAMQAGLAFLATPIGLFIAGLAATIAIVVGAFKFMVASMNSTEEGSNKLARVTAAITGVFKGFWKLIKPLGEWLGNAFIAYIEAVGKALDWVTDKIADAMEFFGMEKAAQGIRDFKEEIEASSKAALELAKAEQELEKAQRKAKITQLEYQKQAEKLRQLRDDESKSIGERISLNNQLGDVLKKQLDEELTIAKLGLKAADARIASEGETTEALDKRAEALTEIADIEERITGQESEQLANLNSLRKEAADKAREIRTKALEDAVTKMKLEYDIFIQNEGEKAKAVEERLSYAEKLRQKEIAIAQAEYEKTKKTENDKLALTKATNDANLKFVESQTEAVISNAEREYNATVAANKSKLDSGKFLTEQLYNQEIERINNIAAAEKDLASTKITDAQELQIELSRIDEEAWQQRNELTLQREEAERNRKMIDLENQRVQDRLTFDQQMAIDLEMMQIKRDAELADAEKTGASKALILKKYANIEKNIVNEAEMAKLSIKEQMLGQAKNLFRENTLAYKILAISEATINTYLGATKALAEYAYPVGGIFAGLAIAQGLVTVSKIAGVKLEKGGLMEIGGNRHSNGGTKFVGEDGTTFEAERGELIGVMNRNAARHFMNFNNSYPAGGATRSNYFASGGIVSRDISSKEVDYSAIAAIVIEANATAPAPVVLVQDIAEVGSKVINTRENSSY